MAKFKGPMSLEKIGIKEKVRKNDKVVIKTHFGALENTRYLRPSYIRFLCDFIRELGAIPYVAESCGWGAPEKFTGQHTEYSGRSSEEEYLNVALQHGFTNETMGAQLLMLDGPDGIDIEIQEIEGKNFKEVLVAGRLREFDHLILATHFKSHYGMGFGGAIKNLGIGCVSKGGKTEAHTGKKFDINFDACKTDCTSCISVCPTGALIKDSNNKLKFDRSKCKFCYMCNSMCKEKIIDIGTSSPEDSILQMVDNAKGVVEYFGKDKIYYINYAIDITWMCDCCGGSDVSVIPDIGILSSKDPVALDQATIDLSHLSQMNPHSILSEIENLPLKDGKCDWFSYLPRFDSETRELDLNKEGKVSNRWEFQLQAAEEIGLGSRDYNLIEIIIKKDDEEK